MTQVFTEEGVMIPVTVIEARPNKVIQIKTKETDGYDSVQIGYMDLKESRANKPTKGHFERWGAPLKKHLVEVRLEEGEEYAAGQEIKVSDFEEGRKIDITGTSKGKGTQGNIKRHGHHRGPVSHGSKHKRLPGALAAGTYPSRVFKGNAGPGRMGNETVTVQNLDLIKIIPERHILLIKGAVPGSRGGVVCVRYAIKAGYPDDVRLAVKTEYAEEEPVVEETVDEVIEETIEEVIEETVEEAVEAIEEIVEEAEKTIEETIEKVVEEAEEIVKEATETIKEAAEKVIEKAEKTIEEAKAELEEAVAEIEAEFEAPAEAEAPAEEEPVIASDSEAIQEEAPAEEEPVIASDSEAIQEEAPAEEEPVIASDSEAIQEEAPAEAEAEAEEKEGEE